jgi:hypothetical protein
VSWGLLGESSWSWGSNTKDTKETKGRVVGWNTGPSSRGSFFPAAISSHTGGDRIVASLLATPGGKRAEERGRVTNARDLNYLPAAITLGFSMNSSTGNSRCSLRGGAAE